jgi:hypothetical protein
LISTFLPLSRFAPSRASKRNFAKRNRQNFFGAQGTGWDFSQNLGFEVQ